MRLTWLKFKSKKEEIVNVKTLIVCCDATWSSAVEGSNYSNLAKIANFVANTKEDGSEQIVYYDSGVGTYGAVDSFFGGYTGVGVDQKIAMAYLFLVNNYEPGDKIYLFGYSRGAYVIRCLIGLLETAGLLRREKTGEGKISKALTLYRSRNDKDRPDGENAKNFRKENSYCSDGPNFKNTVRIEFLGAFDSIGGIGIPGVSNAEYEYHDLKLSSCVRYAYHALAAHENAWDCYSDLWIASDETTTEQVWFPGRHSDIGGLNQNTGLSDITLSWMLKKAQMAGLTLIPNCLEGLQPNYRSEISSKTIWDLKDQYLFARGTMRQHICTKNICPHEFVSLKNQSRITAARYGSTYLQTEPCRFTNVQLAKELLLKISEDPSLTPIGLHPDVSIEAETGKNDGIELGNAFTSKETLPKVNSPKKRIIICCDGTSANAVAGNNHFTNVAKIASIIQPCKIEGGEKITQVKYYDSGVGTHEWADPITGGLTGTGMDIKIQMAYLFLVNNFNPGDELFFFGFSRGAYTVRSLVGLINAIGILKKENARRGITNFFDIYKESNAIVRDGKIRHLREMGMCYNDVPVKMIGVFDTVSSIKGLNTKFHQVNLDSRIEYAYHALAANERRYYFYPELWVPGENVTTITEQRWFPGSHSDLGGQNTGSQLSDIALSWMLERAQEQGGLSIDQKCFSDLKPDYSAQVGEPASGWKWTGLVWRHICDFRRNNEHDFYPKDNQSFLFWNKVKCPLKDTTISDELCSKISNEIDYHVSTSPEDEKILKEHCDPGTKFVEEFPERGCLKGKCKIFDRAEAEELLPMSLPEKSLGNINYSSPKVTDDKEAGLSSTLKLLSVMRFGSVLYHYYRGNKKMSEYQQRYNNGIIFKKAQECSMYQVFHKTSIVEMKNKFLNMNLDQRLSNLFSSKKTFSILEAKGLKFSSKSKKSLWKLGLATAIGLTTCVGWRMVKTQEKQKQTTLEIKSKNL